MGFGLARQRRVAARGADSHERGGAARLSARPPADIDIDAALVRSLLRSQHPDLADLPLEPAEAGWDNVMFRLGSELAVRMPRRAAAAAWIEREQRWLPELAPRLPLAVPAPVRIGQPEHGYPWRWSVVPWLSGEPADLVEPSGDQAVRFAEFLRALHVPAPPDAPRNEYRGVLLSERAAVVEERMNRVARSTSLITPRVRRLWEIAVAAPLDAEPTWLHGDLHPRNVLVAGEAIAGIIDWGDVAAGDRATDLAAIWMLFGDPAARERAMRACGSVTDATWLRARGWAIFFGSVLADAGLAGDSRHGRIGERTLHQVVEGP